MNEIVHPLHRFIRPYVTSTTNCPGCGNGIAAQAILRAHPGGEPFGFDRFEKLLEKHGSAGSAEIRRALLEAVASFTRNRPPEDDQTLVVVSFEEARDAAAYLRRAG